MHKGPNDFKIFLSPLFMVQIKVSSFSRLAFWFMISKTFCSRLGFVDNRHRKSFSKVYFRFLVTIQNWKAESSFVARVSCDDLPTTLFCKALRYSNSNKFRVPSHSKLLNLTNFLSPRSPGTFFALKQVMLMQWAFAA